jgi:hypothetical protein
VARFVLSLTSGGLVIMRKLLALLPMALLLGAPVTLDAKDKQGKKNNEEWRYRTEPVRGEWRHGGTGHFPHDANGDGIVTRREWPGNDQSFRKLDRNGDGVLSERDRKLRGDKRFHEPQSRR